MENQEINQEANPILETQKQELIITNEIKDYLLETVKWGKFISIVGYVGVGIILLISLFFIFNTGGMGDLYGSGLGVFVGILYFTFGGLYLFPIHYLNKFSTEVKQALQTDTQLSLVTGFENLKSLFKFMGIMMIVMLSIYALIFLAAFIGGVVAALAGGM